MKTKNTEFGSLANHPDLRRAVKAGKVKPTPKLPPAVPRRAHHKAWVFPPVSERQSVQHLLRHLEPGNQTVRLSLPDLRRVHAEGRRDRMA